MADFLIRWADWSGGDFGTLDPAYAEKNQYSGRNVVRYNSGLIGPRAGLKAFTVNWGADPGTHPVLGPYGFDVKDDNLLISLDDETFKLPFLTAQPVVATKFNAYPSALTQYVRFAEGNRILYGLINGDLYRHNGDNTITNIALPGGIKLSALVRWGYYLVGVQADKPYRIWHSTVTIAGADFNTWGVNNYLDVGSNLGINTLRPILNTLYAGKADGWWAISGVLGEQAYVRQRSVANGPVDDRGCTVTTDNRILYWPKDSLPAWFNGDRPHLDRDFELTGYATEFAGDTVVATPTGQRLIMLSERADTNQAAMLLWDKKWSKHTFDIPISAIACSDVRSGNDLPEGVMFMCQRPTTIGDDVSIVSFDASANRPAHVDDDWAAPLDTGGTDLITGELDLPAHWEGQGRHMRVVAVIVQFRKWPSGVAGTRNELRCKVVPKGRYGGGTIQTETKLWSESSELADAGGTDDSVIFTFDQETSAGFQIQFPMLRGVAIREVIARVEARTART